MSRNGKQTATNIKLLTIGDSAVGKTCLISQFARDSFNPNFITTIGIDYKIKEVDIDGNKYKLLIWDTAGQERFRTITTSYFRGCQGILLVYDITARKTYDSVSNWMDQINLVNDGQYVCKILIGNKCDLPEDRKVTEAEGRALAAEYDIPFMETSAKTNINVQEAFTHITEDVVKTLVPTSGASASEGRSGKADLNKNNAKKKKGCC
jgi:Ras-related protein Rab-8A